MHWNRHTLCCWDSEEVPTAEFVCGSRLNVIFFNGKFFKQGLTKPERFTGVYLCSKDEDL